MSSAGGKRIATVSPITIALLALVLSFKAMPPPMASDSKTSLDRPRESENLELSKIFDWYGKDFRQGYKGIASLEAFAASHADQLADAPTDRAQLRSGRFEIAFLDYDWSLNDAARAS